MTDNDICREYREAKDKWAQIQILSDLNLAKRIDIINILLDNGEEVRMPISRRKGSHIEQDDKKYYAALFKKLDELDAKIAKYTDEYREIAVLVKRGSFGS